ncbi:MAG: ribosomal-processing cysteine protease Prp [Clostridia bacterium]|nr:ribosomal-processing cysteine protease Prp [Clostridia bacterium]
MIHARLNHCGNQYCATVDGHSGYAPRGSDIVCAAASMLWSSLICYCENTDSVKADIDGNTLNICGNLGSAWDMFTAGFIMLALNYPQCVEVTV